VKKLFLLLILLTLAGCSSHRVVVITPATEALENFSVLEVERFATNVQEVDQEALSGIPDEIVKKVSDLRKFREVTRSTDSSVGVLVMKGTILSYEKGSRTKRYLLGLGAGKAYVTVQCVLINKATGQEIFKGNFEGELAGGFFGGGSGGAEKGVASAVSDYFKKNY